MAQHPIFCFMRLSGEEVKEATRILRPRYKNLLVCNVRQVPTKHSILLRSDDTSWKLIPRLVESHAVLKLHSVLNYSNPIHITLHCQIDVIGDVAFFAFPAQFPPLTEDEVKKCLCDFMLMTATALEELHNFGFAHLDVRIPNICFAQNGNEYILKLIDLDRSIKDKVVDVSGYNREMYKTGWSASQMIGSSLVYLQLRSYLEYHNL